MWLRGSFVASCDNVFDWYVILNVFLLNNDFSTKDGWLFSLVVWLRLISCSTSCCVTYDVRIVQLQVCYKVDFVSIGCRGKLFGCVEGNLENTTNGNVFDAWRKWSCGVVYIWPRTNSDTIVCMFIWFCYLEWMIYGGRLLFVCFESIRHLHSFFSLDI